MAVTKKSIAAQSKQQARADTSTPDLADRDLQAEAQAGYEQATGTQADAAAEAEPEPTSYVYTGGMNAVVVVIGGTAYDFRKGDPVHLARPDAGLDSHPDFARVEAAAEVEEEAK